MKYTQKNCYMLTWPQVGAIINEEISSILGRSVRCVTKPEDIDYWGGEFADPITLVELCVVLQAVHSSVEEWEAALPDEGGTEIGDISWELCEALLRRNLQITWAHRLTARDGLWLLDVSEGQETTNETVSIGGTNLCFADLRSKDDLLDFFKEGACDHATLMEFCEGYKRRYENDLCWPYTLAEGKHLGRFLVLVKEGVLSLPYDGFDGENYEFFSLEGAHLMTSAELMELMKEWKLFSEELMWAVSDMTAYLNKKEGEVT